MRYALFIAPFGELADPRRCAEVAARAEAGGWDGMFVWDHMLYAPPVEAIADPWVTMAAMACATERIALGPMVTPIARRRPWKLAREAITLDHLSGGRLVLGAGLGGDPGRELSAFGEEGDARSRARLLDEGLDLIVALWAGERVDHRGAFQADGVRLLPRPLQRPRIPIWLAARWPHQAPVRRAARYDGLFPIGLTQPDQAAELSEVVAALRRDAGIAADASFDLAVTGGRGVDPAPWATAGATWWLVGFGAEVTPDDVAAALDDGPPRP